MKKWIALLLALVMCLSLCACGGGDKSSSEKKDEDTIESDYDTDELSETKVISAAKENWNVVENLANKLGFKQYYSPQYGTCTAKEGDDGLWTYTLKGTMSGYVDDYHSDLKSKQFTVYGWTRDCIWIAVTKVEVSG